MRSSREDAGGVNGFPSWAKVGAKVVLVDGKDAPISGDASKWEGGLFTILELTSVFPEPAMRVRNDVTGISQAWDEWGKVSRYRPLVADKSEADDVALFSSALTLSPADAEAVEKVDSMGMMLDRAWELAASRDEQ